MSSPTKLSEQIATEIGQGVQKLHHVEPPQEKVVLPSPEDIAKEKSEQALNNSIETFNAKNLKAVETEEKIVLPTKEDIEAEKKMADS